MSAKQRPRLIQGDLMGRVYVTRKYLDRGDYIVPRKEHDVTEDFERIEAERRRPHVIAGRVKCPGCGTEMPIRTPKEAK